MNYTAASPILGRGQSTAAQIDRWFAQRGPDYAPDYAPDGTYKAPPPLGASIVAISNTLGINADLVAAQVLHETAAWQSRYARERNNPGGLGAINSNPDLAIRFPTPAAGIRAHVSHLSTYAKGDGPWTADDPRYDATPVGWRGSVSTLAGLDGKWAYPGVGYGAGIAKLANQLLTVEVGAMGNVPKPQMDTSHRSPHMDGYGTPRIVQAAVQHIANGTLQGTLSWFASPTSKASSNYLIAEDGTIYEVVPPDHSAWTNGQVAKPDLSNPLIASWVAGGINPNTRTLTIEHVGQTTNGAGGALTPAQWDASVHLNAWLAQEYGYPADRAHLIGHYQIDNVERSYCPGFSADEWQRFIADVAKFSSGEPTPPADDALYLTYPDGTRCPHPIVLGFRAWCEAQGRARGVADLNAAILSVTGYPSEPEWLGKDGRTYQRFERIAALQYNPKNQPPFDVVPVLCGTPLPDKAA